MASLCQSCVVETKNVRHDLPYRLLEPRPRGPADRPQALSGLRQLTTASAGQAREHRSRSRRDIHNPWSRNIGDNAGRKAGPPCSAKAAAPTAVRNSPLAWHGIVDRLFFEPRYTGKELVTSYLAIAYCDAVFHGSATVFLVQPFCRCLGRGNWQSTMASISLRDKAKRTFPDVYARYVGWQRSKQRLRVAEILSSLDPPQHYDSEFDALQTSHTQYWPDYRYDFYSTWARGYERAGKLLKLESLRRPNLDVFEMGCGDGMTGHALASYGHCVTLNDTEDWRDSRVRKLAFVQGNVCGRLSIAPESFDLLISYNTFEHIEDPSSGLSEMIRLCRKGGHIFIEFNLLYCSPLGLHAFSFLMPYPQFLFSPSFVEEKVKELGANDLGQNLPFLQPTNKWRLSQFRQLWRSSECEVVSLIEERVEERFLEMVLKFPRAFCGRELNVEDLIVNGISVLLRKR